MAKVTWNLPDDVTVIYSSLTIPDCERDELNREVAAFRIGDSLNLDVEWDTESSCYIITLFTEDIESPLIPEISVQEPGEVKGTVEQLVVKYSGSNDDITSVQRFVSESDSGD